MPAIIGTFPATLVNGTTEDATVVMSLFQFIQTQVNTNSLSASSLSVSGGAALIGEIQTGTGSVQRTVQDKLRDVYNAMDVAGMDNTGAIECAAALQTAINNALAQGKVCEAYGTFKIGSKVVFKGNCNFSAATFNATGIGTGIAVEVSTGSAANPTDVLFRKLMFLPAIINLDKPGVGWAGQGTGLRTVNTNACEIHCPYIGGFATGLWDTAYSQGNVYNTVFVQHFDDNKINHLLQASDSVGWVNENLYLGGRYAFNSGEGVSVVGTRHIAIRLGTAGWSAPNNNKFIKPSIEGDVPEFHVELEGTLDNLILDGRWEASTPKLKLDSTNGTVTRNEVRRGYGSANIVVTKVGATVSENTIETQIATLREVVGANNKTGINMSHRTSDTDYGILTGWPTTVDPVTLTGAETNWGIRVSNTKLHVKAPTQAFDSVLIDYRVFFGAGLHAPVTSMQGDANDNIFCSTPSGNGYMQPTIGVASTALLDKTHAINTNNRTSGKWVYVTDTSRMVYCALTAATAPWYFADGTVAYTPV